MTGKMVVPVIRHDNGMYTSQIMQQKITLQSEDDLKNHLFNIENMGLYPYLTDEREMESLEGDKNRADTIFKNLITERLFQWVEIADRKLLHENRKLFICPGNDDDFYIDKVLSKSKSIINLENTVYDLGDYQILSTGHSNPTPWHTPREISEEKLEEILANLSLKLDKNKTTIFNIHVPPYNSKIDECAELDSEYRVVTSLGHVKKKPVGSTAVRKLIEKVQPTLGLFGHVHEGRGLHRIGRTLCVNPGSNYQEGVLNGCIITIERHIVTGYQFIIG